MSHLFGPIIIDDFHKNKINELRQALGKKLEESVIFDDDYSLIRWLVFYDYKVEKIVENFHRSTSVIRCLQIQDLEINSIEEVNEYINNLFPAAKHFPGYDKEGHLIILQALARSVPRELVKCGRVSDLYRLALIECTLAYRLVK